MFLCHVILFHMYGSLSSQSNEAETSVSVLLLLLFSGELLTQWLWAQHWHVASVTVPSVRPRGPSAVQVTTALIWLISLMSLFLGGTDKQLWPEHAATRQLHFARTETQISWELLTYIHLRHTLSVSHTYTRLLYHVRKHEHTLTHGTNMMTHWHLCQMIAIVNIIHHTRLIVNTHTQ